MNYLAHAYLSFDEQQLLAGNIFADSINNRAVEELPIAVQSGVQLHRLIDSFSDRHPRVLDVKQLLYKGHGKYAGVIVDVYWDYFLYKYWREYTSIEFDLFESNVHKALEANLTLLPSHVQQKMKAMMRNHFLRSCATIEALQSTFNFINKRLKFDGQLELATNSLKSNYDVFDQVFLDFFPDLIKVSKEKVKDLALKNK